MDYNLCLHPDLIDEMVEELFATDIISQDLLKKLKNDALPFDPNLIMDVRHKEVKKEPLIEFTDRNSPDGMKKKAENNRTKPSSKVKDLKTIDKEILNTRRCLEEFNNKLEEKQECLTNSILDLERKRTDLRFEEEERESPMIVKLNEQETAQYFNMHLDRLEGNMNRNKQKDNVKTWRPIDVKSPVINVITSFKELDDSSTSMRNMEEEIKLVQMFDLKPFHINGKSLEIIPDAQTGQNSDLVPNNSPIFNVSVTLDDKNKLSPRQKDIINNALRKWRLYVRRRKIHKWMEGKTSKLRLNLYQKYFSLWVVYAKQRKEAKENELAKSSNTLQVVPAKCCMNQKRFGLTDTHKAESETVQDKSQINVEQEQKDSRQPQAVKKLRVEMSCKKVIFPCKDKKEKCTLNNIQNISDKVEVHVKTLSPQDVGLVQQSHVNTDQVCKKHLGKRVLESKDNISSRNTGESLIHRFEAQEKIIKQQRELIEKQNRVIFDLQAKCLEIESKLNWTLAERQLAEAESKVTKPSVSADDKPINRSEPKRAKPNGVLCYDSKTQDKSGLIVKNMIERQAYCSQLAEQTRLRKKRIEEERQRSKLEQEEKQKQEKEEERRKRIFQMKLEQQIVQEKERSAVALKKKEAENLEKAVKHYKDKLLRRSLITLKTVCLEVSVKFEDCDNIYRQKLTRRTFNVWKEKVKNSIQSKYQTAERHYQGRLLKMAWDNLCKAHQDYKIKLQVSQDLYSLKLQERMFHRWQAFSVQRFLENCCKVELAERLYRRQLLKRCLYHWKELPRFMFKEREKEQRRRAWRDTVQQLIPDFTPAYVDEL